MCDADHDYLGRPDYYNVVKKLREEMLNFGIEMNEKEWLEFQLNYLEKDHRYFTETAKNIRLHGKKARIEEIRERLKQIED